MKCRLLLALTLLAWSSFGLYRTAHAGLLDSMMTSDFPTKEVTAKYKLEVYGYDVRVYEWIPKDNPDMRCVLVAGNKNSTGVSCYSTK